MFKLIYLLFFLLSFTSSFFITKKIIQITNKYQIKQIEREYLYFHQKKAKTPTLGGISLFLTFALIVILLLILKFDYITFIILISLTLFFLVGLIDDLTKLKKGSKGLNSLIRLLIELMITLLALHFLGFSIDVLINLKINGLRFKYLTLPLLIILFLGTLNSANFTDGLDGLLTGLSLITLLPILMHNLKEGNNYLVILNVIFIGALSGFLIFNIHPAKIFLGDCGSLLIGGFLIFDILVSNLLIYLPLLLVIYGAETLTIILQVGYFKIKKKRLFLMAPLHHHFEMKNIEESRIVFYFYLVCYLVIIIVIGVI